jgi:hypothetical protein
VSDASPRPWFVQNYIRTPDKPLVCDANGECVADDVSFADAHLIVDAVNARDKNAAFVQRIDKKLDEAVKVHDILVAERDELRDICVLLFDAVKHGNQVVGLPGIWNKAKEVLRRTDPEDKP